MVDMFHEVLFFVEVKGKNVNNKLVSLTAYRNSER